MTGTLDEHVGEETRLNRNLFLLQRNIQVNNLNTGSSWKVGLYDMETVFFLVLVSTYPD